jgi:transcriptional/translational regulatory protein YebC/TACO1
MSILNPYDLFNKEGLYLDRKLIQLKKLESDLQELAKKQWQIYDQTMLEISHVHRLIDDLEEQEDVYT